METESESYFDLSFGKCSQTARRNDDIQDERNTSSNIFTTSRNDLMERAQRNLPPKDQLPEITDEHPIGNNIVSNKKSFWNNIDIMSARELPHPRHLRKRKKIGVNKEDRKCRTNSRMDHGMMVENHLKQLKFYCSRVSREVTPTNMSSSHSQNNIIKTITLDDIEIPPLPETPALHRPVTREMYDSINVPIDKPISRSRSRHDTDRTPGFDRFPYHQADCITSFQPPGPVTFQSTSRRLNFEQCSDLGDWVSGNHEDAKVLECKSEDEDEKWYRQNWRPRCVFTPGKEE